MPCRPAFYCPWRWSGDDGTTFPPQWGGLAGTFNCRYFRWWVPGFFTSIIFPATGHTSSPYNCGKLALLGAVYYQVLTRPSVQQLVLALTATALLGMLPIICYDAKLAVTVSWVAQRTLLAGFALLYLEQHSAQPAAGAATHDTLCQLGIGQLLFSALTVTTFSLMYLDQLAGTSEFKYLFLSLSGLVFNWFLKLAFLRATRPASAGANEPGPTSFKVRS